MTAAVDPHRVLGLEPGASQAEVKRAYRRLAKALHPDAAGEAALPAFLELQDAYERLTGTKVRTVRPTGAASGGAAGTARGGGGAARATGGATEGFREPWRADPARARAAREQARSRRGWQGDRATSGAGAGPGPTPGGDASAGTGHRPGAGSGGWAGRTRSSGGSATGEQAETGAAGGAPRGPGRRRASRKATLGSTSYDEAREPSDRSWAGASWYGPTTGEYWIVNPREYADPRKHGPGYTSRGRPGATETRPAGASPDTAPASVTADAEAADAAAAPQAAAATEAARAVGDRPVAEPPAGPPAGSVLDALGAIRRASTADPIRRLGLVLLAWPPLGLAAATAIDRATGCLAYSASCDATDRLLPWLAQAVLLGVLLVAPLLARILSVGTIAALLALVPGAALITALGGAGSSAGPPVLAGWLILAWAGGVGWAVRRAAVGPSSRPGAAGAAGAGAP